MDTLARVAARNQRPSLGRPAIEENLRRYFAERQPCARYASFDYAFNYFQSQRERDAIGDIASMSQMQLSCLHLGFYLASWGMLRGSGDLLQRSIKFLEPLVTVIAAAPPMMWEIDAHSYSDDAWWMLEEFAGRIRTALGTERTSARASDTMVTKIMLGVFGCVPAFDTNFKGGFGVSTFSRSALQQVAEFYHSNAATIERYRWPTLDFDSGRDSSRRYTRAKVIDMIFFVEGREMASTRGVKNG